MGRPSKPELTVVSDANPMPPTIDVTPSAHTTHSAVYENECKLRLSGFESGIVALNGELDSRHEAFEQAIAKLTREFNAEKSDLLRRIDDMQTCKAMAAAALDAFEAMRAK